MFTKEEDTYLLYLVSVFGTNQWNVIASLIGSRNARQCRERYKHYLSPHINNSPWTSEEDFILLSKYEQLGPRWAKIASFFNGRTDVAVKNRYTALLRENDPKISSQTIDISKIAQDPSPQPTTTTTTTISQISISTTDKLPNLDISAHFEEIFNDDEFHELMNLFDNNEIKS